MGTEEQAPAATRADDDMPVVESSLVTVWPCCGCSCHVCEHGHHTGDSLRPHTQECLDRFWEEAEAAEKEALAHEG